jgi:hypothetical protein
MKTVFKVGMKVYDQLFFPDIEGVVTSTNFIPKKSFFDEEEDSDEDYIHPYPVEVDFKGEQALYKNDGSGFMNFPTLSTKPYEVVLEGFEQKEPEITYEKIILFNQKQRVYIPTIELKLPNDNMAEAFKALAKLIWLRDYYNEGWQPDWEDDEWKYFIEYYRGKLSVERTCGNNRVLAFKSKEIRDKFLEEQKELLEIAKPLL